jgi:hypothetical protein
VKQTVSTIKQTTGLNGACVLITFGDASFQTSVCSIVNAYVCTVAVSLTSVSSTTDQKSFNKFVSTEDVQIFAGEGTGD